MSGLGLLFAFSQPVTKSMPPAVTPDREDSSSFLLSFRLPYLGTWHQDLAVINGWDLTCDKARPETLLWPDHFRTSFQGRAVFGPICLCRGFLQPWIWLCCVPQPASKQNKGRATWLEQRQRLHPLRHTFSATHACHGRRLRWQWWSRRIFSNSLARSISGD